MPARTTLLIGIAALLLAAPRCAAQPPPAPPGASARAGPADGCRAERPLEPGTHRLRSGGIERRFLLSVPAGAGPHPVILDLHGLNSTAARQAAYGRLPERGARRGYVVATPQAAEGRMGWTLPHTTGPDDTAFLAALLDHLARNLCVDARRQFAAGMSYGAAMALSLVCGLGGRLSAVAAVAGLNIVRPCPGAAPTTIVAFHGTADRIVPYRGGHPFQDATGDLRRLADLVVLDPVERAATGWAALLGCTGRTSATLTRQVRLSDWRRCPGGVTLRLYTIDGGGHTWPGTLEVPWLGSTTREVDATELILDTFDRAPSR
ncbi:alpha/beta hydrolase family esterase [Nonomuraea candida]|uniref:alpha/beta hydrolase family esterase n=1 Tax=Nonomuraea candida TaxID=359159 RepID=UPI000694430A|nr:PHB depolymerase family esterase [Nonomuraea candida]